MSRFTQWQDRRLPAALGRRLKCPGGYQVSQFAPVPVRRSRRLAAGMQFTNLRRNQRPLQSGDHVSADALQLIVRGTTDTLRGMAYHTTKGKCACCGAKSGGLVLNDAGKLRLRIARRRAAERQP